MQSSNNVISINCSITAIVDCNWLLVAELDAGDKTKTKRLQKRTSCNGWEPTVDARGPAAVDENTFTFVEPFVPIDDSDDDSVPTVVETVAVVEPFVLSDDSDQDDHDSVGRQPPTSTSRQTPQLNSKDHYNSTRQVSQGKMLSP